MSVRAERPPSERTLLAAIDNAAKRTVQEAERAIAPIVARETPRGRTGKVAASLRPKARRTASGAALTVAAPRSAIHDRYATVAQVVRWLNRGTGVYREGPGPKVPIRPKRRWRRDAAMILPGGKRVKKVLGQRPNPFLERINQIASPRVERIFRDGANDATRAVERVIG